MIGLGLGWMGLVGWVVFLGWEWGWFWVLLGVGFGLFLALGLDVAQLVYGAVEIEGVSGLVAEEDLGFFGCVDLGEGGCEVELGLVAFEGFGAEEFEGLDCLIDGLVEEGEDGGFVIGEGARGFELGAHGGFLGL